MKVLKSTTTSASIAHKKLHSAPTMRKRKAEVKKNLGAPKRPPSAFFIFMDDFRKIYKENFPDNKSVAAVTKAGGAKWKAMSGSAKACYLVKATKKKEEYEKAKEAFNKNAKGKGESEKSAESEKSSSEVQDDAEQEASS